MKRISVLAASLVLLALIACRDSKISFYERLQPVPADSGFKMDGYWVWCGSVVKVDSLYHMFAARWPKKNKFPDDYFRESEIVRATSRNPLGPYTFQEMVIGERDSLFWDSNMAHNPTIHRIGDQYVLFYLGSDFTTYRAGSDRLLRRIGYATSSSVEGPWKRSDVPLLEEESNNPAVFVEPDGSVKMMYRDEKLTVKVAVAPGFAGPYEVRNDNVWPATRLEDFYLFRKDGMYHMICEDNLGDITGHVRWGAHFVSDDGITGWKTHDPVVVYDHDIRFEDGALLHCERRERPQLIIENGRITHLVTGVYVGSSSWSQPVALIPPLRVDK